MTDRNTYVRDIRPVHGTGSPVAFPVSPSIMTDPLGPLARGELVAISHFPQLVRFVANGTAGSFAGITYSSFVQRQQYGNQAGLFADLFRSFSVFTTGIHVMTGTVGDRYSHGDLVYMGANTQTITSAPRSVAVPIGTVHLPNGSTLVGAVRVPFLIDVYTRLSTPAAARIYTPTGGAILSGAATTSLIPFSPPEIPGLVLWLESDTLAVVPNGTPVTTWSDQSGFANHATQGTPAAQPQYLTGAVGTSARPAIIFDGVNDLLTILDASSLHLTALTLVAVARIIASRPVNPIAWKNGNTPADTGVFALHESTGQSVLSLDVGGGLGAHVGPVLNADGAYHVIAGEFVTGTFRVVVDATAAGGGVGGGALTTSTGSLQLGGYDASSTGPVFGALGLAAVVAYNRMLTLTEEGLIVGYLKKKYGL